MALIHTLSKIDSDTRETKKRISDIIDKDLRKLKDTLNEGVREELERLKRELQAARSQRDGYKYRNEQLHKLIKDNAEKLRRLEKMHPRLVRDAEAFDELKARFKGREITANGKVKLRETECSES